MSAPTLEQLLHCLTIPQPVINESEAARIAAEVFGVCSSAKNLGGERDANFLLQSGDTQRLLKFTNSSDADDIIDLQCKVLRHATTQIPDLPIPHLYASKNGKDWVEVETSAGERYRARLLSYLPGVLVSEAPDDQRLMRDIGATIARLDRALRGFTHSAADHWLTWDIKRASLLEPLCTGIRNDRYRELVEATFKVFSELVDPRIAGLRAQVIHNDVSFHNSVVARDEPWSLSGIYDFGDVIHAPLIQELAVAAGEIPAGRNNPISVSAEIVAGFHSVTALEHEEFELLPVMAAMRLAMTFAIGNWKPNPDNRGYLEDLQEKDFEMLKALHDVGFDALTRMYRAACGLSSGPTLQPSLATDELLTRRKRRLGKDYELSYEQPFHAVRGEGVWLYEPDGSAYLDCYNNVPQVGHCHPQVVSAIASQAATLNTNTRYLYESVVDFADELTSKLPAGLDVCMLVSSGSEANDLAWRIATTCTGHTGALVMKHAYHGVTQVTYDLSPYAIDDRAQLASYVEIVDPPDDYRGIWKRDEPARGDRYAADADVAIERLATKGHAPAMFMVDTVFSSNGILKSPPGFLTGVFERVRAAGGLCVADEVQAGFGRTGEHMWGFELDGVVPDIVTFGKPIGNGHPMGAVVTRRELAEEFQAVSDFFSTTGGNPVSCRAASAVLDVIEAEHLQDNAYRRGNEIRDGISNLAKRHPLIGDVRGPGLFIGVELVRNHATLEPAPEETKAVINGLRRRGVLVGREGPHGNCLKIRPPIVFQSSHVDKLVETLDEVLRAL